MRPPSVLVPNVLSNVDVALDQLMLMNERDCRYCERCRNPSGYSSSWPRRRDRDSPASRQKHHRAKMRAPWHPSSQTHRRKHRRHRRASIDTGRRSSQSWRHRLAGGKGESRAQRCLKRHGISLRTSTGRHPETHSRIRPLEIRLWMIR